MAPRRIALLAALLLAARVLLLASAAEVNFFGEELGKGVAAKAMLDRLPVEHWKLIYVWHEGGGFAVAHLKALAFLLVGESILAHKLAALALTLILMLVGLSLARECFGARAALLFGLFFALAPESYLRFSLMSLGTHFEATIFIALVLRQALRIARAPPGGSWDWALLGVASGFGLYFSLQVAAAIACAGLLLLVELRGRLLSRRFAIGFVCALVGVTPLLCMLSKVGLDAIRVRGQDVIAAEGASPIDALRDLFAPLEGNGNAFDWALIALIPCVSLLGIARNRRREFALPWIAIAGYCALFLALYCGSGLAVGSHGHWGVWLRTSPLWFGGTLLAAAGLARLWDTHRAFAIPAIGLVLVAGLDDLARLARAGDPTRPTANLRELAREKGLDYVEYLDKFVTHLDGDAAQRMRIVLHLDDDSDLLPASIAHSLFEKSDAPVADVLAQVRAGARGRFEQALLGLGAYLHPGERYDFDAAYARLGEAPPELQPRLAEAIGRAGLGPRFRRDRLREQVEHQVPARWRDAWLRGTGWRVHMAHRLDPLGAERFLASCAPTDQRELRTGYAVARASTDVR